MKAETPYAFFKEMGTLLGVEAMRNKDGFIDIAPLFKGIPSDKVAKDILRAAQEIKWDIQAVLTYAKNAEGQSQLVLFKLGVAEPIFITGTSKEDIFKAYKPLEARQVFKYWPQTQVVGSDLPSAMGTTAFATFGNQVTLDKLIQGDNRKRGLTKSTETICHIINSTTAKVIRKQLNLSETQKIETKHLILIAEMHKQEEEKKLNYQATLQMLDYYAREAVLKKISEAKDPVIKRILYDEGRGLIVSTVGRDLFTQFGAVEATMEIGISLKAKVESLKAQIPKTAKYLDESFKNSLEVELNAIVDRQRARAVLPEKVSINENKGATGTMQQQAQEQQQQQEEVRSRLAGLQTALDKEWPDHTDLWTQDIFNDKGGVCPKMIPLKIALASSILGKEFHTTIDDNILVTENFLKAFENQSDVLLSSLQKPVGHLLFVEEADRRFIVFLSRYDEKFISKKLLSRSPATTSVRKIWLINPHGDLIMGDEGWQNPFTVAADVTGNKERQDLLIQALVFKGDVARLESDSIIPSFKEWLQDKAAQKKQLFMRVVDQHQQRRKFQKSKTLRKLFN